MNMEAVDKRKHVVELRRSGLGWDEIAKQAGYASRGAAYTAFTLALKEVVREPTRELVELELQRLDTLFLAMWELAKQGDFQATDHHAADVELGLFASWSAAPSCSVSMLQSASRLRSRTNSSSTHYARFALSARCSRRS